MPPPSVMPIERPTERAHGQAAAKQRGAHAHAEENCTSPLGALHEQLMLNLSIASARPMVLAWASMFRHAAASTQRHTADASDEIMRPHFECISVGGAMQIFLKSCHGATVVLDAVILCLSEQSGCNGQPQSCFPHPHSFQFSVTSFTPCILSNPRSP